MFILTSLLFVLLFSCMGTMTEDGHCIWYGECGRNALGKITNCYYNGTAPQLTDEAALRIIESTCSMFYNGSNTFTCCAPDQIRRLADQLGLVKMLLGRCPSCYYNFRSLFCATTCHPQQSRFITVKDFGNSTEYPGTPTVESIINLLAGDFVQRILDSCRDVRYPGGNEHSLDILCGRPYDKCTKEAFVEYLGVENPAVQFPIYFILRNNTSQSNYYNQSTFLCSEPVETPYEHQSVCSRLDCPSSPGPPDVPGKYSNTSLRTTQLIIVPNNQTFVKHYYASPPAPFSEYLVGPALELGFLTQVLALQTNILNLETQLPTNNRSVRLTDICLKPMEPNNNSCVVFSVLQYFQNSLENLNKTVGDDFFLYADYITHIFQCAGLSYNDTLLNISCFADFGGIIDSSVVLTNYPSTGNTLSAKALVTTIIIEDSDEPEQVQSAEAWEEAFLDYMQNFTDIQALLPDEGRWDEMANFTVYYSNEHFIKRELNNMIWSNNQSIIKQ